MNREDQEKFLAELPPVTSSDFKPSSVEWVNQKPHPYCITPKHLEHSPSPVLNEWSIEEAEKKGAHCGMYTNGNGRYANGRTSDCVLPCRVPFKDHTRGDQVLFIQALRKTDSPKKLRGLKSWLLKAAPILKQFNIDGVAFVAKGG